MKPFHTTFVTLLSALLFGANTASSQDCMTEAVAILYTSTWADEVSYTISDDNGILAQGQGFEDYGVSETTFCVDSISGCLVLEMFDSFGDGWGGSLEIYLPALGISLGEFSLETGGYQAVSFGEGCETTVEDVLGCMDPAAFNYDPWATIDDGSCIYDCQCDDVYDPVCAIGFDGSIVTYNNLCEAFCEGAYQILGFGDCDNIEVPVYGCTDPEATNYSPEANVDDGSCFYPCECEDVYEPVCAYDYFTGDYVTFNNACEANCAGAWIALEGDCSELPVWGCTDPDALNYNPEANQDDGSCVLMPVCSEGEFLITLETVVSDSLNEFGLGANIWFYLNTELGVNVNLTMVYDDMQQGTGYGCVAPGCYMLGLNDYGWAPGMGSVDVTIDGATTNFDVPEGEYFAIYPLGVETDGCELTIPGCTDAEALNFNPTATVDDGSCQYPFQCDEGTPGQLYVCTFSGGENVGLEITADDGSVLYAQTGFNDFAIVYLDVCLEDSTCYTAMLTDLSGTGAGWNGGYFWVSNGWVDLIHEELPSGVVTSTVEFSLDGTCGDGPIGNEVWGCMDPAAINFNPFATIDDGSCFYDNGDIYGCTDPVALNYDPFATIDDGSCVYPSSCEDMSEVLLILDGGAWPGEVSMTISNEAGEVVMNMDGYTGIMVGCVPAGCYLVEMHDSFGDGWNGAWAQLIVDGEVVGTMTMEEGSYDSTTVGIATSGCGESGVDGPPSGYGGTIAFEPFPNPGIGEVNIIGDDFDMDEPVVVRIVDVTGKVVVDEVVEKDASSRVWTFDASTWSTGMYFIRASQGTKQARGTWMKAQ